jgi:choline dehydrogenase
MNTPSTPAGTFDYVIVGAGAAGCLLANRLSEDGGATVCLLEAGPRDRNPFFHVPGGFIYVAYSPRYTWDFHTEPTEWTAGRSVTTLMGRVLGGSSSINGFNYTRGLPLDFDGWQRLGNDGWGYADVLPYFKRTERRIGPFDARYRGGDGPLPITDCDWRHPLCDAFIEGAATLGFPSHVDYNAGNQHGAGYYQRWIHRGRRFSAATAFLRPAAGRANLEVRTEAHVSRVVFEGRRAAGVHYLPGPGAPVREVRARREVILTAGAGNSPKLLQVSGVGPAALLAELGVPVLHELPGVGENLRDHYMIRSVVRVEGVPTINSTARGIRRAAEVVKWMLGRPSILGISPSVSFAFAKTRDELPGNDVQFHFSPGSFRFGVTGQLDDFPGMTLGFYQLRPASSGFVRARSTDPFEPPRIQPSYLADADDRRTVVDGLRLARRLLHTGPLARFIVRDDFPPAEVTSDADLLDCARQRGSTAWHFNGTCRMGPASDHGSVVDSQLRVIGVEGLRVADASVMPSCTSGNTGAPTMMIAEKAADLIRGLTPPPREYPGS